MSDKLIDIIKESFEHLIGIVFIKSRSKNYRQALELAQKAAIYAQDDTEEKTKQIALFGKDKIQAAYALRLIELTQNWKDTSFIAAGKHLSYHHNVADIIRCYLDSTQSPDKEAYCCSPITTDSFIKRQAQGSWAARMTISTTDLIKETRDPKEIFLFPCGYLKRLFKFDTDHPSPPIAQIEAAAVKKQCHICPNFSAYNFRKINKTSRADLHLIPTK